MTRGILVTARLKSTRLPGKVMKPIHGRPMLAHLLDRLRLAREPDLIALITSPLDQDRPLVDAAAREGVKCFTGDPDDVLLRIRDAAECFALDTIISCTADNPFTDPVYIDNLVSFHEHNEHDFSQIDGLPFGAFSYAVARRAVRKACEIKDDADTENWVGYFTQTGLFRCGTLVVQDSAVREPGLRLTVDVPEDFALIQEVFDELSGGNGVFPLESIVALLRRRPDMVELNRHVIQKTPKPIRCRADRGI